MSDSRHDRHALVLPGLFMLGAILLRLPVMLAHLDTWYPFEIFLGNVAAALLDGVSLDVSHLYIIGHIRGGSLFGLLATPLYWALGSSTLTLKLVPLLWNALTLGLLVALIRRHFSRRGALAVGWVLLLPSPLFAKLATMGFASHMESGLFTVGALHLFLTMLRERRLERRHFALFGLVLGLCASFHMQCLLAALIMAGLLVLAHPRRCLAGALPALLGLLIGAAPMLLFDFGDAEIGKALFGHRQPSVMAVGADGAVVYKGVENKLKAALSEGLAPLLEFGELGPELGPPVAHLYAALLALGCLTLLWRERRGLAAWAQGLDPAGRREPSPLAFFVLHALIVGVLFIVSIMPLESWFVGSGMGGRRLVPMIFSIMIMGALGLVPANDEEPANRWGLGALVMLCLLGAWGSLAAARSSEAKGLEQRGECYEWFVPQLTRESGADVKASFEGIARVDRGDWRFATLRYRLATRLKPKTPLPVRLRWARQDRDDPALTLMRLTLVGRQLGEFPRALKTAQASRALRVLRPVQRLALFHGVGLGTPQTRPATDKTDGVVPAALRLLAASTRGRDRAAALEGYGFQLGSVFEPYNELLVRRVAGLKALGPDELLAVSRGLGWGAAQRYTVPPDHVPEGLRLMEIIPEGGAEAFRAGFAGEVIPPEAAILGADDR